jgi:hypothetical protein
MVTELSLVSPARVRQRIVQRDWAPARIASLRCGGRRSSLCCLRYLSVRVEEGAQAAPRLALQLLVLLLAMPVELLNGDSVSNYVVASRRLSHLATMTFSEAANSCESFLKMVTSAEVDATS